MTRTQKWLPATALALLIGAGGVPAASAQQRGHRDRVQRAAGGERQNDGDNARRERQGGDSRQVARDNAPANTDSNRDSNPPQLQASRNGVRGGEVVRRGSPSNNNRSDDNRGYDTRSYSDGYNNYAYGNHGYDNHGYNHRAPAYVYHAPAYRAPGTVVVVPHSYYPQHYYGSGGGFSVFFGFGSGYRYGVPYSGRVYGYVAPYYAAAPYYAPAPRYYGDVRLQVRPRDAAVYVDGYYAGVVDNFDGVFQRLTLEVGPHEISIERPGFASMVYNVYVDAARTVDVRGDLYPGGDPYPNR